MKVAITSNGPELTSQIAPRFGRAHYFIVFNTDTGEFTAHDNRLNSFSVHDVGVEAAQQMIDWGVEAVITANVDPKAFDALKAAGVAVHLGTGGTVKGAVEQFKESQLPCTIKATMKGNWS